MSRQRKCDWPADVVADIAKYAGREQAYVKHYFLESYLDGLVHKTASTYDEIAYVDGFSGPWQSQGESFEDTSFGIALAILTRAKASWNAHGRDVRMSAHLVERRKAAYKRLQGIGSQFPNVTVHTYNDDFVAAAPALLKAIPRPAFAFVFIDPKGWRIDMQRLAPLLGRANSEIVFNFMFDFINRAASMKEAATVQALDLLIPGAQWRKDLVAAKSPAERKGVLVAAFSAILGALGKYDYVAETSVLRPLKDRTLYSLIYATRHSSGIEVFRNCQKKTLDTQETIRRSAKRVHEEAQTGQPALFDATVPFGPNEIDSFLANEKAAARSLLLAMTPKAPTEALYRSVWPRVLAKCAVTKAELNSYANECRKSGALLFPDWPSKGRAPKDEFRMSRPA